jgi:hypothetical protein
MGALIPSLMDRRMSKAGERSILIKSSLMRRVRETGSYSHECDIAHSGVNTSLSTKVHLFVFMNDTIF